MRKQDIRTSTNLHEIGIRYPTSQSFAPMDSEKEKGSEKKGSRKKSLARKRAGEKQSEESTKRQKIEDDIEKEELKAYLDLVPREEFAMEIESLGTKADGSSKNYKIFSEMLDDFDRYDVLDLHRLVEERIAIHIMIEKKYPLTQEMLSKMLSRKLEVDHENEMVFELLRLYGGGGIFLQDINYQGRLLASFQDDAKYEHVGQDTRSQGGKDDQDKQGKDLEISDVMPKSKDNDKGSRSKIT
ncbi:hypothetical protein Tco_0970480 [Tanacetum coccineum]